MINVTNKTRLRGQGWNRSFICDGQRRPLRGDGIQTLINEMRKCAVCYLGDGV